jgi:menaquinone-dependent protoporphyrinogen oxidase
MAKPRILVAYATSAGSTREIAGVVAEALGGRAMETDLKPMREVRTLDGYAGVVLGVSLYMFHWHRDMGKFLSRFRSALSGLPVGVFSGGPTGTGDEKEWQVIRTQVDGEFAKFPWFQPAATLLVGGKFDPQHLPFPYGLIPAMKNMPAVDLRDWAAIRAWADSLAGLFQSKGK